MQLLILSAFTAVLGLVPKNPTLASVPEKLRLYQNVTAMSDETILSIFKKSLEGSDLKFFMLFSASIQEYTLTLTQNFDSLVLLEVDRFILSFLPKPLSMLMQS